MGMILRSNTDLQINILTVALVEVGATGNTFVDRPVVDPDFVSMRCCDAVIRLHIWLDCRFGLVHDTDPNLRPLTRICPEKKNIIVE